MSWSFLYSAIMHAQTTGTPVKTVRPRANDRLDFNLGAPAVVILASSAVEAFVNEASSIAHNLGFMADKDGRFDVHAYRVDSAELDFSRSELDRIASIRECGRGSFTERYKRLLGLLHLPRPSQWEDLCSLRKLRDGLVHFRACDLPIVDGADGVIRSGQNLPEFLEPLKRTRVGGLPVLAPDAQTGGEDWTLRIATNAMAMWALNTVLKSLSFSVESIGDGPYGQGLKSHYRSRDKRYKSLFDMGLQEVANWQEHTQNGAPFRSLFPEPGS